MLSTDSLIDLAQRYSSSTTNDRSLLEDIGLAVTAGSAAWTAIGIPVIVFTIIWEGLSGIPSVYQSYGEILMTAFRYPWFIGAMVGYPLLLDRWMSTRRAVGISAAIISTMMGLVTDFGDPGFTLFTILAIYVLTGIVAVTMSQVARRFATGVPADQQSLPAPNATTDGGHPEERDHNQ